MENLTKQQIILLTLLVSFVTSIATGIVTVALMNQAPIGVTQTINRIVERTIEQVTPPPTNTNTTQAVVKETVVVNADQQVVGAIDRNSKSVIRIYSTSTDPLTGTVIRNFVGIGTIITDDGILVTDNEPINSNTDYFTVLENGTTRSLIVLRSKTGEQVALLKIKSDVANPLTLPKAMISNQGDLKLGQAIVYIGGETKNIVATGIVSSFGTIDLKVENATTSTSTSVTVKTVINSIETTLPQNNLVSGGLLLNLTGDLVGIKSTYIDSSKTDLFVPSSAINSALSAYRLTLASSTAATATTSKTTL